MTFPAESINAMLDRMAGHPFYDGRLPASVADADDLPGEAGAYLLVVDLDRPFALKITALPTATLLRGRYLYAGSAYGPGGIRARVRRHMTQGKRPHWHIDRLTAVGRPIGAYAFPYGHECDLIDALVDVPGITVPVSGFGSSDCATCPAHLLLFKQAL